MKTSLNYCEHSNRTKVICNDVEDALIDVSDCKIAELYDYHIDGCSDPVAPGTLFVCMIIILFVKFFNVVFIKKWFIRASC